MKESYSFFLLSPSGASPWYPVTDASSGAEISTMNFWSQYKKLGISNASVFKGPVLGCWVSHPKGDSGEFGCLVFKLC